MTGPLAGLRIIEMGGIGPGPFAGMMLADHGAEVIRIDRPGTRFSPDDTMARSRTLLQLDLKRADDVHQLRTLVRTADGLFEGFRPGTMERLDLGPDVLLEDNPRLVYGRMTGWGQYGPYAPYAGHDINYISLSGALHLSGPSDKPVAPPMFLGDLGGGGMLLAFSMVSALLHAVRTGQGQVIDCAMTDGSGLLAAPFYGFHAGGTWKDEREANFLDGGSHYYNTYRTSDDKWISIGSLEPQFYALLLRKLELSNDPAFADQNEPSQWPEQKERLTALFSQRTRDEWCTLLEHSDVCFAPVLGLAEAPLHPHAVARGSFIDLGGVVQPAPAPRYSATPLDVPRASTGGMVDQLLGCRSSRSE